MVFCFEFVDFAHISKSDIKSIINFQIVANNNLLSIENRKPPMNTTVKLLKHAFDICKLRINFKLLEKNKFLKYTKNLTQLEKSQT